MPWRTLLPELLSAGSFRTQGELVRALGDAGHDVNQATISRELAAMGVAKIDGVYRMPASPALGAPVHRFRATANECLVVIHTDPAFAMVLAQAIDGAVLDGVLGTVAGDDTVFVATTGRSGTETLAGYLGLRRSAS